MKKCKNINHSKNKSKTKKSSILLIILIFLCFCTVTIYTYVHQLENAFLNNTLFYMSEIAEHDMKSVDKEISNQWNRLETIGKKLTLEQFRAPVNIQHFLNLETNATGFKELKLIDENGNSYSSNYVIEDISNTDWGTLFMKEKKNFVIRNQSKDNFVVLYSNILYGVPIEPITINDITYIGIIGKYSIDSVKESLKVNFFSGEGLAEVVNRDGTVITTDITQRGISLENILDDLKNASVIKNDSYEQIQTSLAKGEPFETVFNLKGETYIMASKPLENSEWMVVVTVPYSVSSSQTLNFLKMTIVLLIILCIIIAFVLTFSFITYKRTIILKNSKEIFYRERLFNLLTSHTDDVFIIQDNKNDVLNFVSENVTRILGITPHIGEKSNISFLNESMKNDLLDKVTEMKQKTTMLHHIDDDHAHTELDFDWCMPNTNEHKWMHMVIYDVVPDFTDNKESSLIIVISDYTRVKENQKNLETLMKQAQDAAKSKTLFLSNMSHEMRTPLNGIVGCIEMMKTNLNNKQELSTYLDKAESTSHYLISLVSDILDMSKIESHKMTLDERDLSLKKICGNMDTMFRSQMEMKGIQFDILLKEPIYIIRGDEVRIQQILINLLGNALKFTDSGGFVSLEIYQDAIVDGTITSHFIIKDTGIGMSESFIKRIWTPFEQERLDNARLHGGTGLGLAISYELATLMNGSISVESKLHEGSAFHVEITQPAISLDTTEEQLETTTSQQSNPLSNRHILVAEDNELNREILVSLLTELGATVIEAENGYEAVKRFEESPMHEIDAILMDMQMPIMDGCSATENIRKQNREDATQVIIIACTANAFQEDIERVKQVGMNEHIAKPLDMQKLLDILNLLWRENPNEKQ